MSITPMLFGPSNRTPSERARHQPGLPRRAFGAGVGEAAAQNRDHRDAARAALLQRVLDGLAGCHDKGVIDLTGRFGQARPGALAEHFAARGIDRHDAPRVAVLAQEA
jgi:hypothetical protein